MTTETVDRSLLALIVLTLIASVVIALAAPQYFDQTFAAEDRLVEYGTAVFLLVASAVQVRRAVGQARRVAWVAAALTVIYALLFFFAAGEEISWGQRIFDWETNEFFEENNAQGETNFHNFVVGGQPLTRTLFGSVLTTALLLYLVVLPLLYPRVALIRRLADALVVPVPGLRHAGFAVVASLVIAVIEPSRKWEVYELIFALLATSIFILPTNRDKID